MVQRDQKAVLEQLQDSVPMYGIMESRTLRKICVLRGHHV